MVDTVIVRARAHAGAEVSVAQAFQPVSAPSIPSLPRIPHTKEATMTQIAVATSKGLTVARSGSGTWHAVEHLQGNDVQALAVDPLRPAIVYSGTFGQGLWRSDDAGDSWHPVGEGIAHPQVMSIAVSALERSGDAGVVYAGTEPSALYRSTDGGATWRECAALRALPSAPTWSFPPRPYTSHVRCITLDPRTPGVL